MKNAKSDGSTIKFTAGAAYTSGDLVLLGTLPCIAVDDIANGAEGIGYTEGVYELTKKGTDVIAQGAAVYWDSTPGEVTTTATANQYIGTAWASAGNGILVIDVKLGVKSTAA